MKEKSTIISFIISFIVVGSLIAVFTWNKAPEEIVSNNAGQQAGETPAGNGEAGQEGNSNAAADQGGTAPPARPAEEFDPSKFQTSSTALMGVLVDVLKNSNEDILKHLTSGRVVDETIAGQIKNLINQRNLKLSMENPFIEVGSWDGGNMVRYRLHFEDGSTGVVDLKRTEDHLWVVDFMKLPDGSNTGKSSGVVMTDSMGVAESFVQSLLNSDFEMAHSLVDPEKVNNATLAGLCILFEEGGYGLRPHNALKGMFLNDGNAGYLVYLNGRNGSSTNMGVTLKRDGGNSWKISEVSLDSLLASYVKEVAEGQDVYVPLVKNPKGGDSLVLFFGFNEDTLTARSLKQLEIVAGLVKLSSDKKLEISGHTDDVGSEGYNQNLSERRAAAVKAALVAYGVPDDRITTKGFGKKTPRRTFGSGDSDVRKDEARRVNRRAEMYLDF